MYALGIIRYRRSLQEIAKVTDQQREYPFVKNKLLQYELLPWNALGGREDFDKI